MALGYLPENVAFQPAMTGAETLAFYARLKRQDVRANVALLATVGLAEAARRRVGTYSKGMRQRLGLAAALLAEAELLVLDEPTNGLDPQGIREIRELILQLHEAGTTIFLSSHLLAEAEQGRAQSTAEIRNDIRILTRTIAALAEGQPG